ncbi:SWI/SNF-related matrix-associated actin-dependent regulator of chromatin subfamily A member 5 [Strongyloides ratti]|uniref:SWI/SNF-related matrix-associated actin-dependent regulator of chromatin subfamily A member 5 n=1 Tax=Strongyloides ratti TaxID=34506 RepID=A0A090L068_STRRB|nr:SWI/SNF-related matrix-associated actin-dependent regulator of chromatin subfamily A member 5 [Strongyloides ratti]CEF63160.1 SWI/SNF-related matrix-associated actin-dependent regulator of chromatin subfamily A member 5 [Strongyloides ratti]
MVSTRYGRVLRNISNSESGESSVTGTRSSRRNTRTVARKRNSSDDFDDEFNLNVSREKKIKKTDPTLSSSMRFEQLLNKIEEISGRMNFGNVSNTPKKKISKRNDTNKRRHSFDECDNDINDGNGGYTFTQSPSFINGEMRDYQIHGLNWLITLRTNNVNGILADEMGLGKTLQTISILAYVKFFESEIKGTDDYLPSIIIVPLSTLNSWATEFKRWTNGMRVLTYHGNKKERGMFIKNKLRKIKFDIVLTTYEMFAKNGGELKKIPWEYVVIDEAHRIRTEETILRKQVNFLKSRNKLLLTGTPLQNNLHELWSLLNFLQPQLFNDADDFDNWFDSNKCLAEGEMMIEKLHKIINPFILRRIKKDVEKGLLPKKETTLFVGLSNIQKTLYKKILLKESEMLINGKISKAKLLGIMQQLRKVVSHPYLFPGIEPGPPYVEGEHIITSSGKLNVLDKLLVKLKSQGSRVLIFSQFIGTLDILEDYMTMRNFTYHRFDGSTLYMERQEFIDEFQEKGSETFAFLISTRAGGLGITLTAADVVIFYDVDWNPQVDLQAADRAHRIGQKKEVKVFRIITEGTIDERICETAERKLRLDNLVIQKGRMNEMKKEMEKEDLMGIIRNGVSAIDESGENDGEFDHGIEEIIEKSCDKFKVLKEKLDEFYKPQGDGVLGDLQKSNGDYSVYKFEGDDYKILKKLNDSNIKADQNIISGKRKRNLRFDNFKHTSDNKARQSTSPAPNYDHKKTKLDIPFPPDYQTHRECFLCYKEYIKLSERYVAYFRKCQNFSYIQNGTVEVSKDIIFKQRTIDNAIPLTNEETKRMYELKEKAFFSNWSTKDFSKIKGLLSSFGMDFDKIRIELPDYDVDEIKRYSDRLIEYAEENNMITFLFRFRKAEQNRVRKIKRAKYINDLFDNARGDPLDINLPNKMFSKKNRSVNYTRDLELDKHIFYYFISEIRKNDIDVDEISEKTIIPLLKLDFVSRLKREVKFSQNLELNCSMVVSHFLNIIRNIDKASSVDVTSTNQ